MSIKSILIGVSGGLAIVLAMPLTALAVDTPVVPVHVSQCQKDGYEAFGSPGFDTRLACVSYVRAHNYRVAGNVKYTAYGLKRHAWFHMNRGENSGKFHYSDDNGVTYTVKVSDVSVNDTGHYAYFAGVVTDSSQYRYVGQWLLAKVYDSYPTFYGNPDLISGSFTDKTTAINAVENMTPPADGPFTVTKGDLSVWQISH